MIQHRTATNVMRTATHVNPSDPDDKVSVEVTWDDAPDKFGEYSPAMVKAWGESEKCTLKTQNPSGSKRVSSRVGILETIRVAAEEARALGPSKDAWLRDWTDMFPEFGLSINPKTGRYAPN